MRGCILCAVLLLFVISCLCVSGRSSHRTSGELLAVLTRLSNSGAPRSGLFERIVLCCVFCLAGRSFVSCLSAASRRPSCSRDPGSRLARYGGSLFDERGALLVHEKSGALRGLHCMLLCFLSLSLSLSLSLLSASVSLLLSWCASLSGGTMRRSLSIVEVIRRRLLRCPRNCSPRGSVAGTIVGALCCERFCCIAADRGMLFWTAPR